MLTVMSMQSELPNSGEALQTACPAAGGPVIFRDAETTNVMLTDRPPNPVASGDRVDNAAAPPQAGQQIQNGLQQKLNKRRHSMNVGFKHPGIGKRRRRANSESDPVLPSNFLLGGNIFDPLNLNSLLDEEVNKVLNAQTPKSSPLPAKSRDPVEILIPKDITDPLNLSGRGGDAAAGVLVSPMKSRRRHRNRHHGAVPAGVAEQSDHSDSEKPKVTEGIASVPSVCSLGKTADVSGEGKGLKGVEESPRPYELNTSINCRDEVVAPILPRRRSHPSSSSSAPETQSRPDGAAQPSKHRKRRRTTSRSERLSVTPTPPVKRTNAEKVHSQAFHTPLVGGATGAFTSGTVPGKIRQNRRRPQHKFQYGNYSHYYGYRTPTLNADPRLGVFRPEWFHGKKVLDVGCNTGHITLAIARHWKPSHILGLDIDGTLVHTARQNLRHFISELWGQEGGWSPNQRQEKIDQTRPTEMSAETGKSEGSGNRRAGGDLEVTPLMKLQLDRVRALPRFPLSFTRCRGPIATPPIMPCVPGVFPLNVCFLKGNYVPDSDTDVMSQCAEYDVILCLSLTKWVHLNFGDAGIQRLFHRIYRHLLPGGVLILEPQPWSSYARRKTLTEVTHKNYSGIRLKPDQFSSYLTSDVGFNSYELLETPHSCPKGFRRWIYVFHKGSVSDRK